MNRSSLLLPLLLCLIGCPSNGDTNGEAPSVTVEYKDGYFTIDGVPESVGAVQVRLDVRSGTYSLDITAAVTEGKTEKMCVGAMFRTTYPPKSIVLVVADNDGNPVATVKNKSSITLDGTTETQNIPYSSFE